MNSTIANRYKLIFEKAVITLSFFISLAIIYGWFFGNREILRFIENSASMKFNTAIVLLLASISLVIFNKKNSYLKIIKVVLGVIIIVIGLLSLISDFGYTFLNIDNLVVFDTFSLEKPGLMSRATAISSVFLGSVFCAHSNKTKEFNVFQKTANLIVFTIAIVSIISYLLLIPLTSKTEVFQTMAIHTSLLFLLISIVLMLKNPTSLYNELIVGNYAGNKVFKRLIPKIIIVPIVAGNVLLILLDMDLVGMNFGIVSFTVLLIILSFSHVYNIAVELNSSDKKRTDLEKLSLQVNLELAHFKEAVNKVAIVIRADKDGTVRYVNDSFCEISQYSKKEVYGKTFTSIINSDYHDDSFFESLWNTINSGKKWTGNIKNKRKDGTHYWLKSNIIPLKNNEGQITEFMFIDTLIDGPSVV